jgi:hypothetical protein
MKRQSAMAVVPVLMMACDPAVYLHMTQPLRPVPPLACLRAAIDTLPEVVEIGREFHDYYGLDGFSLLIRVSTGPNGLREGTINRRVAPKLSDTLDLQFRWGGFGRPAEADETRVTSVGRRIMSAFRASCASGSPARFECHYEGGAPVRSCAPAT